MLNYFFKTYNQGAHAQALIPQLYWFISLERKLEDYVSILQLPAVKTHTKI